MFHIVYYWEKRWRLEVKINQAVNRKRGKIHTIEARLLETKVRHYSLLRGKPQRAESCFEGSDRRNFAKFSGGSASLMIDHIRGWR